MSAGTGPLPAIGAMCRPCAVPEPEAAVGAPNL